MLRSRWVAFYGLRRRRFCRCGGSHCDGVNMFVLWLRVRSEVKQIVHRMSEILFAAEIAFCGLHRCMPQQELNLLQLATTVMTQLGAGPP